MIGRPRARDPRVYATGRGRTAISPWGSVGGGSVAGIARGGGRGGRRAAVLGVAAREAVTLGRSGVVGVAVLPSHWGVHFHRSDEMLLKQKKD